METLNKLQYDALRRAATTPVKTITASTGIEKDRHPQVLNELFKDFEQLVKLKLFVKANAWPRHRAFVKEIRQEGRKVLVGVLTVRGQAMFGRVPHDKWVN